MSFKLPIRDSSQYIISTNVWPHWQEQLRDSKEQKNPDTFSIKFTTQLCVDKDGDEVQLVDEWTDQYNMECDKLMNREINNQEIKSMLLQSKIPTESYVIREILECANDMAYNNKNESVLRIDVEILIFDEDKAKYLGDDRDDIDV
ncbi:hypothetical protein ACFE04_006834 [Oxalis oulophora]